MIFLSLGLLSCVPALSTAFLSHNSSSLEDLKHARWSSFVYSQVEGTTERPRLCVFRSNKHIYAQVIDDSKMHTLASASTVQKPISEEIDYSAGPTIVSRIMLSLYSFIQNGKIHLHFSHRWLRKSLAYINSREMSKVVFYYIFMSQKFLN